MSNQHNDWMRIAVEEAYQNVQHVEGGPFGAIVVKDGKVIGRGRNLVTALNDPTAHAEVQAIRQACAHIGDFQLKGCVIYTSCEPCPMCLGAIYWSRPDAVYYASTKRDAAEIGFDDHFIYDEIQLPMEQRSIPMIQIQIADSLLPFQAWQSADRKIEY
ncbi:guanine deaminase [Paenibacillus sp. JCM 10914]|uniref:nucleoside deaminase n=1 Tax=Paenibacillus sp. JCM 10914 TaxID=1236974 RepID=UPI0003CCABDF|nr:nucleoside deaminase [Paenibacillus sp. JCM 10914]GAE08355.1 tRNA-specific adenosine-34 deaminase [Paenibacillus sp. JCM 10914]